MRKILLLSTVAVLLAVAYFTKPDDKTCIIATVEAVWGARVPDKWGKPGLYEQFMNLTSKQVVVDDWIFMKRLRYRFPGKEYRIGFGLFNRIVTNN